MITVLFVLFIALTAVKTIQSVNTVLYAPASVFWYSYKNNNLISILIILTLNTIQIKPL
jgi:hypothetical protein